jgi:hypothetical protein
MVAFLLSALSVFAAASTAVDSAVARTAAIEGRVLIGDSEEPLPDVEVVVRIRGTAFEARSTTGVDGRFQFAGVPHGTASVSIQRYPFIGLPQLPGLPDGIVTIADVSGAAPPPPLVIRAVLGGVITGRVYSEFGTPAIGVTVRVERAAGSPGEAPLALRDGLPSSTTTDELGDYRVAGLPAGTYLIAAVPRETTGGVTVVAPPSQPLVDLAQQISQKTTITADDWAMLTRAAGSAPQPEIVRMGPAYFPGVPSAQRATPVRVSHGATASGVDIVLIPTATTLVEGRVVFPDGTPAAGSMVALMDPMAGIGVERRQVTTTDSDGRFRFGSVAPGDFRITADAIRAQQPNRRAEALLSVFSQPITDLVLALSEGMNLRGQITSSSDSVSVMPLSITLERSELGRRQLASDRPTTSSKSDGSFEFQNVAPGKYRLRVASADQPDPDHWVVEAQGRADDVVDVGPGRLSSPLAVRVIAPVGPFPGRVEGASGDLSTGLAVVVVADDDRAPRTRPIVVPVDAGGGFMLGPLRVGAYRTGVIWFQPDADALPQDVVDAVKQSGERLVVEAGTVPVLILRVRR